MTDRDREQRPAPGELATLVDAFLGQGKVPAPPAPKRVPTLPRTLLSPPLALGLLGVALVAAIVAVLAAVRPSPPDPFAEIKVEVRTDGR
jgi:hypothetical protein